MQMFGAKPKNEPLNNIEPLPPSVRAYAPPRPVRTYAEAAAEAAQHEIDQQNRIHALQDEIQQLKIRLDLVEKANEMLHEDAANREQQHTFAVAKLTKERDNNLAQYLAMSTTLRIAGNAIAESLEAARDVLKDPGTSIAMAELEAKIAGSIAPDHEAPRS